MHNHKTTNGKMNIKYGVNVVNKKQNPRLNSTIGGHSCYVDPSLDRYFIDFG